MQLIRRIIVTVVCAFPAQAVWQVSCVTRQVNISVVQEATSVLNTQRQPQAALMLQQCMLLFRNLVELAQLQPKERAIKFKCNKGMQVSDLMI